MKLRTALIYGYVVILSLASIPAYAEVIFEDSFESANTKSTNTKGFKWENNNRTSVVIQHPVDGPVAVWNNGSIYNIQNPILPDHTRDWSPRTGEHSLRFTYPAGQKWSEQRFNLGTPMRDIWIQFWIRVPLNFSYGPKGSPAKNNKFFAIWMDGYGSSGQGSTVWLGLNPINTSSMSLSYSYAKGNKSGSGYFLQTKPFVTPADRGRWMQIAFHAKAESSEGANDGIIQTFMRWEREAAFTKLHEDLNAEIRVPTGGGPIGFNRGYILGWSNAVYENKTEWLLDNFIVSDTPATILAPSAPKKLVGK